MLGVAAYLLIPALHAVHADDHAHSHAVAHAHHHHHHHDGDEHHDDDGSPDAPHHDADSCSICQLFFALQTGVNISTPDAICLPPASRLEPGTPTPQVRALVTAVPARTLRGPPMKPAC